jgi:hypothetical protein
MINDLWEYRVITRENNMTEKDLNEYGIKGWELVFVNEDYTISYKKYIFKRQRT